MNTEFEQKVQQSLTRIEVALGGDKLGTKGLIEQVADLKEDHYKVKAEVKKMKTVWTVLGTVFGIVITGINILIAWFKN